MIRILVALLAAGAALCASPTSAQMRGAALGALIAPEPWGTYAGASIGDSDFGTGAKAFVGRQFHPQWAWEVQVLDFGTDDRVRFGARSSAVAVGASAVGVFALNAEFAMFTRLGVHTVSTDTKLPGFTASNRSVELGAGIGARYRLNSRWSFRFELERIGGASEMFSLGAQLRL